MTIENVIPGLLYKTSNVLKAEEIRAALRTTVDTDIEFKMSGPMVQAIQFSDVSCSKVASKIGDLIITPKTGGAALTLNITSFMQT